MLKYFLFLLPLIVRANYFRVSGTHFEKNINGSWNRLESFASVNLGPTKPGYLPGEGKLTKEDYLYYFNVINDLGIDIIRVYALHPPIFYQTLLEWNEKHSPIYILHGTAFPELELEENNGTSVYEEHITEHMIWFLNETVTGVYGIGEATYATNKTGYYDVSIEKYLFGWIISGEIYPLVVHHSNLQWKANGSPQYNGQFFSSFNHSSGFEVWVAQMFDFLAMKMHSIGTYAPISHTNWVTTDGISNEIEDRYPASVEDFEEIDLKRIDSTKWMGGMYYNQHIYPYYPDFITVNTTAEDPFYHYVSRVRDHYDDKPFIITEMGVPTSKGISSFDHFKQRHHGGVTEMNQALLVTESTIDLITHYNITGVIIFELLDEWFKKSWNVLKFEREDRQMWKNALSPEQYFGILSVESNGNIAESQEFSNEYITNLKFSNDFEYFNINYDPDIPEHGEIVLGINTLPSGSTIVNNLPIYKTFSKEIDILITIAKTEVNFYISSVHSSFHRNYGEWLEELPMPINEVLDPSLGNFVPFIQLVKSPTYLFLNGTKTFFPHETFKITFDDVSGSIKIPYVMLGYANPAKHQKYLSVNTGREYQVKFIEDSSPINIEASYFVGQTEMEQEIIKTDFIWDKWVIPKNYCYRQKDGYQIFKKEFHKLNNKPNTPFKNLSRCHFHQDSSSNLLDSYFHQYLVIGSYSVLAILFSYVSIGKVIFLIFGYCRNCIKNEKDGRKSWHQRAIAFLFLVGIGFLVYFEFYKSNSSVTIDYVFYLVLLNIESLLLLIFSLCFPWKLHQDPRKIAPERSYDELYKALKKHAFVIACHNSSDVIEDTVKSIWKSALLKNILIADNGSSKEEIKKTKKIAKKITASFYKKFPDAPKDITGKIKYGNLDEGNKTYAHFGSVFALDDDVEFVTFIDDDTRLHSSWSTFKVLEYFKDQTVAVLAYPLTVQNQKYDIEDFQLMEYLVVGFMKIVHSYLGSTIFNSGAFGTYRVSVIREALLYHSGHFHGDDLQICLNIHQLTGKKSFFDSTKTMTAYRVKTATNMIASTITPQCWFHANSLFPCYHNKCDCGNPDLFKQRSKGWFYSQHLFLFAYIRFIFNCNSFIGIFPRIVAVYDVILTLNEYFLPIYFAVFFKFSFLWFLNGFIISYAFHLLVIFYFNMFVLTPNDLSIPSETIVTQPFIYKTVMITLYRYAGIIFLWCSLPWYEWKKPIIKRLDEPSFRKMIRKMYSSSSLPHRRELLSVSPGDIV